MKPDPDRDRLPELDWYMERYPAWRSLFDGTALEEKLDSPDDSSEEAYRWPVRFNMVKAYCKLYGGLLWGRGTTTAEADDLFDIRVNPKDPMRGEDNPDAIRLQELLNYWWSYWFNLLRPCGIIQQWAGGCVLKVVWDPFSEYSVLGAQLQVVQPEHFYPVWNPVNYNELIAVNIRFTVSKAVAIETYGLTVDEVSIFSDHTQISVDEQWNRREYRVLLGKGKIGTDQNGIIGRIRRRDGTMEQMAGRNPFIHPRTKMGIIPFVYVPRIRTGSFFGDSLAYDLEGLQEELNKTLADFGDTLTRSSHPPFGISDYHGKGKQDGVLMVPRFGALNMGLTPAGRESPKVHEFPEATVPPQTEAFVDRLLELGEVATGLTPAARGGSANTKSGFAVAMELLPTTNTVDWQRTHWTTAIANRGGINECLMAIWGSLSGNLDFVPPISPELFNLRQGVEYRPVVPRDRLEVIDEVTRLATAKVISPQEWLKRLGDIEDIDDEFLKLAYWTAWIASIEAATAGRALEVSEPTNPENPAHALPEVSGQTLETDSTKQPAKEAEGLSPKTKE